MKKLIALAVAGAVAAPVYAQSNVQLGTSINPRFPGNLRAELVHFGRQRRKVDHRFHFLQRIAQPIELGAMSFRSKQIRLDCGAARHGSGSSRIRTREFYQRPEGGRFFEVPE